MGNRYIKELRSSIIAPPGHKLVVVDSKQIEGRTLPWAAGDTEKLAKYEAGIDIYAELATDIYGYPVNRKKQLTEGMVGKTGELGLGYGMGAPKFRYTLAVGQFGPPVFIEEPEAKRAVEAYRKKNSLTVDFWRFMDARLVDMLEGREYNWKDIAIFHSDGVDMPNGLTLWYPGLEADTNQWSGGYRNFTYQNHKGHSKIYGALFTENFIQSLARIIVGWQILQVADDYRVVMMSHDEVTLCVPANQAERALEDTIKAFEIPPTWCKDLPVGGDGSIADNYGDAK